MNFKGEISNLSKAVCKMQNNNDIEYITDEEAVAAINILNFAYYKNVADIFLACASFNLLSAYAKQKDCVISYNYRKHLNNVLKGIEDINEPSLIHVSYNPRNKMRLLIISIMNFQFSFQSIKHTNQIKSLQGIRFLERDGIRKQKCASTIFNTILESDSISNKTLSGNDLRSYISTEIQSYNNGGYNKENGRFIKIKNLPKASDEKDYYLKNHIRTKLYACQDRPVIISAVFRKIWDKHVTFISVKPFIPNTKVITICNHINILRKDLESVIDLNNFVSGKRYYIIGYCKPYNDQNRMGIQLAINEGFVPIFDIMDYKKMPEDIESKCHRFNAEEFISPDQKKLKL